MKNKIKAQVFTDAHGTELYGYAHPIVYNEISEGSKIPSNKDVPPIGPLYTKEALEIAAKSLSED